jgi:hypothetical protein
MTAFSDGLMHQLRGATVTLSPDRPRILLGPDEVASARLRAKRIPGFVDRVLAQAQSASQDALLFGTDPEIPYLTRGPLHTLASAAVILEDERFAARALEGLEVWFSFPADDWIARPHRPMRCDHAMLNVAATAGIALDLCASFWSAETVTSISERISDTVVARFLETWAAGEAHWTRPDYHWNWKIMCGGEMGLAALACGESIPQLSEVLAVSMEAVLDILDHVPPEGDWAEGAGYWLVTLGFGLRFGLALKRATQGAVDLFAHPALKKTGDYIVHLTEPDEGVFDFGDNAPDLGAGLDYLSLLASMHRRGDWARVARAGDHVTLERLVWDDERVPSALPPPEETARLFSSTGLVTMRSAWRADAMYVGFKSGSSVVGHSHLDANTFVVSAKGQRLLVDEGLWPYAHFLGFFDCGGPRYDFDANGTIAHNTLLVDGQGQSYGKACAGRIVSLATGEIDVAVGDASAAYAGMLSTYFRTLVFVKPDLLLAYDQVSADRPRLFEWLFHHRAEMSGDERLTHFAQEGVTWSLQRVLPETVECWRMSDVKRTSVYTNSNTLQPERVSIAYRSFGPFHLCESQTVLWAIYAGDSPDPPTVRAVEHHTRVEVEIAYSDGRKKQVVVPRSA